MGQDTYTTLIRGYDVTVSPSDVPDSYHVNVSEHGSLGWETDVPVDLDNLQGENEELDGSDALLNYVSNAAVDLYESEKGTLGQGAAAEVQAMRKKGYFDSMQWEDWFMSFKGTQFEEEAAAMLQTYFELGMQETENQPINDLYRQKDKIMYDLDMLNLERMKATSSEAAAVIVISAKKKKAFWGWCDIEDYLARFVGDPLEPQAIAKIRELLDLEDAIVEAQMNSDDSWMKRERLETQMHELTLTCLQQNVVEPTGMDAAPNMAADLASLMEGVDLSTPLEPIVSFTVERHANLDPKLVRRRLRAQFWSYTPSDEESTTKDDVTYYLMQKGYDEGMAGNAVAAYWAGDTLDAQTTMDIQEALEAVQFGFVAKKLGQQQSWSFDWGEEDTKLSVIDALMAAGYDEMTASQLVDAYWANQTLDAESTMAIQQALQSVQGGQVAASKKAFEEAETAEERIEELGENVEHEAFPTQSFNQNEKVKTKRELKVPFGWGGTKTIPKGTIGYAESLLDRWGNRYLVRLEDDLTLIKVRWDEIEVAAR